MAQRRPQTVDEQVDTVISSDRLDALAYLCKQVKYLTGDAIEIGVYRGGSAKVICSNLPGTFVALVDTFKGLPQESSQDNMHIKGDFADTSFDRVSAYLKDCDNAVLFKGEWPNDFPKAEAALKFAHIDVDLYRSTLRCLEDVYPRIISGGIIVMDDYLAPTCEGATKAIEEFFADKPEKLQSMAQYQAYIVKE